MQNKSTTSPPLTAITFRVAFWYWLKLGCISFGGPAGQIAILHTDLVEKRRWISERRFVHALNYCMMLPGPEATQLAIYIGWLLHRRIGGIVAGTLFVLPSLLILIALSWIYLVYGNLPQVAGVLHGIKPAVIAIVAVAAWRIGTRTIKNLWLAAIAVAALLAIGVMQIPFPFIIAGAALLGLAGTRLMPKRIAVDGEVNHGISNLPALIDDNTPTPAHARFTWTKLLTTGGGGVLLGLVAWLVLATTIGTQSPLTQMSLFFSKAALLTFGGAYAVLPYVAQNAVDHFHWLTPAQMIDGLAFGETTPGPLIMIVAFVGFLGGWHDPVPGCSPQVAAIAGACIATFFTFLPSFVFVLAGGPLIESTRDNIRLTAPLTAISAAVTGVIASLAMFFAHHVFRLGLPILQWDFVAIAVTAIACVAMLRFNLGTIKLIFACAMAGLVVSYLL